MAAIKFVEYKVGLMIRTEQKIETLKSQMNELLKPFVAKGWINMTSAEEYAAQSKIQLTKLGNEVDLEKQLLLAHKDTCKVLIHQLLKGNDFDIQSLQRRKRYSEVLADIRDTHLEAARV